MKKDIIILTQTLYGGGAEKYVVNLSNSLILQNYSVEVLVFKKIKDDYSSQINNKVSIHYLHSRYSIIISINIFFFIVKRLKNKPTIITNMRGTTLSSLPLLLLKNKINWIVREANILSPTLNDLSKINKFFFLLKFKLIYKLLSKIICVSNSVKKEVINYFNLDPKKIHVIHNPIIKQSFSDLSTIDKKYQFLKKEKFLLSVGRIHPQKNYEELIKIFKEVVKKTPESYLVICGGGTVNVELKNIVKKYNLDKKVIFTGFIKDISFFYRFASVYCSTSKWEGSPNSILEAMSYELPIIAYENFSGTDEVLYNTNSLIKFNDIQRYSEMVCKYFKSKKKINYDHVLDSFSIQKFISKHLKLIKSHKF